MRNDDNLYISSGYRNYYTFNIKSNKSRFILYRDEPRYSKHVKGNPKLIKDIPNIGASFIVTKNYMWSGHRIFTHFVYICLSDTNIKSQRLLGLNTTQVYKCFPHPDRRSVLVFLKDGIYKITPPENKKIKK